MPQVSEVKMAETEKTKPSSPAKKSYWQGLKAEFDKIVWPDRETATKETAQVIVSTIILGLIIAGLDTLIVFGLHFVI